VNGIYVHIPFCISKCHYCDFYSVTGSRDYSGFIGTLLAETGLRAGYLADRNIDTVYLGGGTPTLLPEYGLSGILEALNRHFMISAGAEITIEANPDDLDAQKLKKIKEAGYNRISIGVQSFSDKQLRMMNRRHNAMQAEAAVTMAADAGIPRISLDLIYGIPGMTPVQWQENLRKAVLLPANHISAYHLTIEPGTVFHARKEAKKLSEVKEASSFKQYFLLRQLMNDSGFEQYEISNFTRNNERSRHNSKYWTGEGYLGLGPAAHSFNGRERHWNPRSLAGWAKQVNDAQEPEGEVLTEDMKVNEYIMTRLRTTEGIDLTDYTGRFGEEEYQRLLQNAGISLKRGDLVRNGNNLSFDHEAWFRSDKLISNLFRI